MGCLAMLYIFQCSFLTFTWHCSHFGYINFASFCWWRFWTPPFSCVLLPTVDRILFYPYFRFCSWQWHLFPLPLMLFATIFFFSSQNRKLCVVHLQRLVQMAFIPVMICSKFAWKRSETMPSNGPESKCLVSIRGLLSNQLNWTAPWE